MPLTDYKVYKHTNLTNGKVYIGITRQDPERRWQKGAGYYRTYFGNAIHKYGWDGFSHEILASGLTESEAQEMEIALISKYKSNDREHGYNISEGGETMYCPVKSGKDNPRAKAVNRIDKSTGETVRFETIHEAATEMGINYRGISKACRGVLLTYQGYVWEYADTDFEKSRIQTRYTNRTNTKRKRKYTTGNGVGKYPHVHQWKKILLIEPDGTEKVFDSMINAAEYANTRANNISRYASGIRQDSSGRRWSICP